MQDIRSYNKVCNLEDFNSPVFLELAKDVFRHETTSTQEPLKFMSPRYWDAAMVVQTLRDHNVFGNLATVLVVASGLEPIAFYLTTHVDRVFAVDRYLLHESAGAQLMMMQPAAVQPYETLTQRLIVQHMDERKLAFPDNTFDAVVVLNTPERAQDFDAIAWAAYEWGRVVKPGGIVSVCTKYRLASPPGLTRYKDMLLPSIAELQQYVIDASGLTPIDDLQKQVSDATLSSGRDISRFATAKQGHSYSPRLLPENSFDWSAQPYLVQVHRGFVFSSLHLALRKTETYQAQAWAQPSKSIQEVLRNEIRPIRTLAVQPFNLPASIIIRDEPMKTSSHNLEQLRTLYAQWERIRLRGWFNKWLQRVPRPISFVIRSIARIYSLGHLQAVQAEITASMIEQLESLNVQIVSNQAIAAELHQDEQLMADVSALQRLVQQLSQTHTTTWAGMEQQIQSMNARFMQVEQQLQTLINSITDTQALVQEYSQQQQHFEDRLMQLGQHFEDRLIQFGQHQHDLVNRITMLDEQDSKLTARVSDTVGQLRLLQYQNVLQQGTLSQSSAFPIKAQDVPLILEILDRHIPSLDQYQAIEISVQSEEAEPIIIEFSRHFGERISSSGDNYRYPNDMWLHIDLTEDLRHDRMFENAAARLVDNGILILLTGSDRSISVTDTRFSVAGQHDLMIGKVALRLFIWKFQKQM